MSATGDVSMNGLFSASSVAVPDETQRLVYISNVGGVCVSLVFAHSRHQTPQLASANEL